jgi:DNA-binding LytR/AlgR family response regulator
MIRAIAIDDEPLALKVIENFCARTEIVRLEKTFNKPTEALKYLDNFPVDLLFLDIQMPAISGMDFYKSVKQDCMVIFTTAYSEYAVESYELNAMDYLLKPFTFERFAQALEKAKEFYEFSQRKEKPEHDFFYIRADYSLVKILFTDILYIEGLDDYIKIHLADQKPVVARMTLKNLLQKLPGGKFHQVHRSFIVPLDKVEQVRKNKVIILGREIPLGLSYKDVFLKLIQ